MKTEKKGTSSFASAISKIWSQYSFIFVCLIIFIVYALTCNGLTWNGAMNIFRHSAVIGIIALGMGMVCLTGEIDLSVGSMLALVSGFSVVIFNVTDNILLTLLFAIIFGAVCGLVNGVLVGGVQMPAFIVTLATMLIYRSFAQYFCQHIPKELCGGGSSVYRIASDKAAFQSFYDFGNGKIATIPIVGIILILMTALFVYIAACTKFGKKIYAIGSNAKAAVMSGINVNAVKIIVFVIAGALVGVGAFLWISMNGSADPATTGNSYEMYAIAAVVLGGISMSGGKGKCLGIIFGAMSYTIIDKIIVALKMDSLINDAIKGIILIVVILIQVAGPQIKAKLAKQKIG
ncbi:MAG: ABC transporter permease [Lachnospiraceae bacterium]|nr:ABC transporter permease [Lachnospiraceae bacterium]MDD3617570.1 ABC transporter permease [Lachnospiraceae bacterium]